MKPADARNADASSKIHQTAYMSHMIERRLSQAERRLIGAVFGDAIDPDQVRIYHRRWWCLQPSNVLMAPDGALWCHPRGPLWRDCYATASLSMRALFVHEMTHVWQAQRGGRWFLPLIRHPFCRYDYVLRPGKPFHRYGVEQQAEIVADAFLLESGVVREGKPGLREYRDVLPFHRS